MDFSRAARRGWSGHSPRMRFDVRRKLQKSRAAIFTARGGAHDCLGQRQPSSGATYLRMLSSTWAL